GVPHGARDTTYVGGTKGSITSDGSDLGTQDLILTTYEGIAKPKLEGQWFNDGFMGAMGELLTAIEEDRNPNNNAADNLQSLALTFAAVKSRATGFPVEIGSVRQLPN
ncbi:MAG: gfo/Idh/MocA family oxidoreductase, partial [Boseongicola sp.]|nr:gfo/Idh/MocA family oxidoreductase [Boseongicola sp.]